MKIIGVSGTNGSGKDTVGELLRDDFGWLFVSVTELLRDECRRRGWAVERENLRKISAQWRREQGLGILVDKALAEFKSQTKTYQGLILSSLRNPAEADRVHELGGQVIWVDADPKVRYARITPRARSPEDRKTYKEFLAEQKREMTPEGDEATLNTLGVKAKADIFIQNNGNDLDALKQDIIHALDLE